MIRAGEDIYPAQMRGSPYEPSFRDLARAPAVAPPVVHHFTGAPRNETKDLPCGVPLTFQSSVNISLAPPHHIAYRLAAVEASTDIDEVTCVACLRSLIPVIAKGK